MVVHPTDMLYCSPSLKFQTKTTSYMIHSSMENIMDNPKPKTHDSIFDVIVVGAGIMGSCTAYHTAKRGHKTLLLEQFDFLHHRASSHGESRTIRATYPEPHYSTMVLESASLWEQAQSEIGYQVYYKAPQLDMGPSNTPALQAIIHNLQQINSTATTFSYPLGFKILNSHQLEEQLGGKVVVPEDWIGVLTELGGVIKPTKAVSMFQALAIKNGAVLRDNTEVCQIIAHRTKGQEDSEGVLVRTANGREFYGHKCVVTAGAWMKKLLESVAPSVKVPIQPLEAFICYWKVKEGHEDDYSLQGSTGFPSFASYGNPPVYGTPCLEYPGLIKVAVHDGRPCDPDKIRNWSVKKYESLVLLKQWVRDRFQGVVESESPVIVQSCIYSLTPDEDFVIDFLGGEFGKHVVIAGGFSGHGFKMGPAVGRILADLAMNGESQAVDLKHFSLSRFENNPKGNVKSIVYLVVNDDALDQ